MDNISLSYWRRQTGSTIFRATCAWPTKSRSVRIDFHLQWEVRLTLAENGLEYFSRGVELSGPARQRGAIMLLFTWSKFRLSSWAVAASLIATATALAATPTEGPSLAEYITTICSAAFRSAPPEEARFLSENVGAMTRMMAGMEIMPSGDVDQDFAAMMIPHHRGAIEMAQAELRHGHNEQLRRIAQGIVVEQQQEIAAMRLALGQSLPPSVAAPNQPSDLAAGAPHPTATPTSNVRREP
jgi:hypothetical protein